MGVRSAHFAVAVSVSIFWNTCFAIGFPSELGSVAQIAEELRGLIGTKFRNYRQSYRVREVAPHHLTLLDSDNRVRFAITLEQTFSLDHLTTFEQVNVFGQDEKMVLITETVVTTSEASQQQPAFRSAFEKIFFDGRAGYDLDTHEIRKSVLITIEDQPFFGYEAIKNSSSSTRKLSLSGTEALVVTDLQDSNQQMRELKFDLLAKKTVFKIPGLSVSSTVPALGNLSIVGIKPPGFSLETYRYHAFGAELASLNLFLGSYSTSIYTPLIANGAKLFLKGFLDNTSIFPSLEQTTQNLLSNALLNEFLNLQVDLSQISDPSILERIKNQIGNYIIAFQNGTLSCTDTRPVHP